MIDIGRSAIDVAITAGIIAFGLSNPIGWTAALGFAVGIGGELAKEYIWKKE